MKVRKEFSGMDMIKTGKFIARCRKGAGLTQAALAEKNLTEIINIEKTKNERLVKAEKFIGWSGVVISLIMVICGAFVAVDNAVVSVILILITI